MPILGKTIWRCNLKQCDVKKVVKNNQTFWADLLRTWSEINYHVPHDAGSVYDEILWCNSLIRIQGETVLPNQKLLDSGIVTIRDIVTENGQLKGELMNHFEPKLWLLIISIWDAVPKEWKKLVQNRINSVKDNKEYRLNWEKVVAKPKCSGTVYNFLIKKNCATMDNYLNRWNKTTQSNLDINEYWHLFVNIKWNTDWTKLQNFQYQLLLGKFFTNTVLFKWKIVQSNNCEICQKMQEQTIIHLLITCVYSEKIWNFVKMLCQDACLDWTNPCIMANTVHPKATHIVNCITLAVKFFIFQQKCLNEKPTVEKLHIYLKEIYRIEIFNSTLVGKYKQMKKRWEPVIDNLDIDN